MSETVIGLGVRDPANRTEFLERKFGSLIAMSQDMGVDTVFVESNTSNGPLGEVIGSIRDYTGRFDSGMVPMLNEPAVRSATTDKYVFSQFIGSMGLPTIKLEPGDRAIDCVKDMESAHGYIVKPQRGGRESVGVQRLTAIDEIRKLEITSPVVLQPYIPFNRLPSYIQARGAYNTQLLHKNGVPKELRILTYRHNDGSTDTLAIARVGGEPDVMSRDEYAYLDLDTIPQKVYDFAKTVVGRLAEVTLVPYVHAAVDLVFNDDDQPIVMEVNTKEPALPSMTRTDVQSDEDDMSQAARIHAGKLSRELLLRQLVGLGQANSNGAQS